MKLAITGATGFVGQYLVREVMRRGWRARCWYRERIPAGLAGHDQLEWVPGRLNDPVSSARLVEGCDGVVHAALARAGKGFRGAEGDLVQFAESNIIGSLRLIEAARAAQVPRFVFLSTCAVHERILDDRPLDETHPTWALSHYGAHKAAIEQFVVSWGLGHGYPICALRPCGIYGIRDPLSDTKWFSLVNAVVSGRDVQVAGGGKEIHVQDVVNAVLALLVADSIAGEIFNACDVYVSELQVATLARELSGASGQIQGTGKSPKHVIRCDKIQRLGINFGGLPRWRETIGEMVARIQS